MAIAARSPIYETDAVSDEPQPPYLNAVVRATTALAPEALLALCLDIERALGRVRPPGRDKASRTLDIDVLLYDARVIDTPALTVPAPGAARARVRAHPARPTSPRRDCATRSPATRSTARRPPRRSRRFRDPDGA